MKDEQFSPASRLQESEQRYQEIIEGASDLIQSIRPDGTFEFVNRSWHKALGYGEDELAGLVIWDVIHQDRLEECQIHFMQVMQGIDLENIRVDFRHKDGSKVPCEGSAHSRFVDGQLIATHGFFRDISERLNSERLATENRKLEEAERARYQEKMAALGKLSAGLSHELNNPAAAASRSARNVTQALQARDALQRQLLEQGISLENWAAIESLGTWCEEQRRVVSEISTMDANRREEAIGSWLEEHQVAEAWSYAQPLMSADVTVDRLADLAAALPAEALEPAVGWIAESLSVQESLDVVSRSTGRISQLVAAVKSYSFRDQAQVQDVDIHEGIENTLVILAYQLKGIDIVKDFDRSIPPVRTYGSGLNQVWTNILDNAADATGKSGRVTITTRREGDRAVVEITDTGGGIPEEVLPRIFEPFYTTKPQGSGTGLGLDIVWRIVTEEHGGTITAESEPGRTTFSIAVPVCPDVRDTSSS
ncbi:MAG: PAS domain S-box protein [Thermomicrobiales bacterium]|nr:PAS domain S-box protein [Thermomicrobiales bacterium]